MIRHAQSADSPGHRADHVENLEEHGLGDGRVELTDVEGRRGGHLRRGRRVVRDRGRGRRRRGGSLNMLLGSSVRSGSDGGRRGHCGFSEGVWGRYCFVDFSATETSGGKRNRLLRWRKLMGSTHTGGDRATAFWILWI